MTDNIRRIRPKEIRIEHTKRGVTIWVNGRWILDASTIKESSYLTVFTGRMKALKQYQGVPNHKTYCFVGDSDD